MLHESALQQLPEPFHDPLRGERRRPADRISHGGGRALFRRTLEDRGDARSGARIERVTTFTQQGLGARDGELLEVVQRQKMEDLVFAPGPRRRAGVARDEE